MSDSISCLSPESEKRDYFKTNVFQSKYGTEHTQQSLQKPREYNLCAKPPYWIITLNIKKQTGLKIYSEALDRSFEI